MSYTDFNLEDFLKDEPFKQWVYRPTAETNAFWQRFQEEHPQMRQTIEEARAMLRSIDQDVVQHYPDEEQVRRMFTNVQERIQTTPVFPLQAVQRWLVAASVVLCLGFSFWFYQKRSRSTPYEQRVDQATVALQEKVNDSDKPMSVQLPDQSIIRLQPHSRISYATDFNAQPTREIYLSGNAFFEVTKNPNKPFLVYADKLITKVLGTSFWVKDNEPGQQVIVEVKTGKVAVFAQSDNRAAEKRANRELEGVVLTPNQQVMFSSNDARMKKSLVEEPLPLQPKTFVFKDQPVATIFSALEEAYGVDIVYDEDLLATCLLTASLSDEPLFEKLRLLCKGIEGQYEVVDAQIVISAKGCR
ncbi:FecR family protein [Larkinella harenae]